MIEKVRHVEDWAGNKIGTIAVVYENGQFGVGVSICRTDLDTFYKTKGKELALERAKEDLKKNNRYLLKDIVSVERYIKIESLIPKFLTTLLVP